MKIKKYHKYECTTVSYSQNILFLILLEHIHCSQNIHTLLALNKS